MSRTLIVWRKLLVAVIFFIAYEAYGARKGKPKMKLTFIIEEINSCENEETEMTLNYTYLDVDDARVSAEFYVKGTYSDISFVSDFVKCESATQTECDSLVHLPIDDYCEFLGADQSKTLSGKFIDVFTPTPKCPLHGRYFTRAVNPYDVTQHLMNFASGEVPDERIHYRWTSIIHHKPTNKTVWCITLQAYLKYLRAH